MIQGTEWLSLKVHGQSFMLHQIRKMVGLVVMMVRTDTPVNLIAETFKANQINIPKAPSLGLLLERVRLTSFSSRPLFLLLLVDMGWTSANAQN